MSCPRPKNGPQNLNMVVKRVARWRRCRHVQKWDSLTNVDYIIAMKLHMSFWQFISMWKAVIHYKSDEYEKPVCACVYLYVNYIHTCPIVVRWGFSEVVFKSQKVFIQAVCNGRCEKIDILGQKVNQGWTLDIWGAGVKTIRSPTVWGGGPMHRKAP